MYVRERVILMIREKPGLNAAKTFTRMTDFAVYSPFLAQFRNTPMLDTFDHAILNIVQENNQLTHAEIGRQVNLSASSVRRRLTRLREDNIIQADVSIVAPSKAMIQAIVMVSFKEESVEGYQSFKARMINDPQVSQCYAVSGEIDFVLIVQAESLEAYEAWGERILMTDRTIGRYTTHIVWSRVKFSTAVRMGGEGARE